MCWAAEETKALSNKILPREATGPIHRAHLVDFGEPQGTQGESKPGTPEGEPKRSPDQVQEEALARAYQQGYREGLETGQSAAMQDVERERGELRKLAANLDLFCKELDSRLADEVLAMSLEIAKLIVRHAVRVNAAALLPALREAVASLPGIGADTTLFLHPDDAALLRDAAQTDPSLALNWKIVDDVQLERGGCRIETPTTEIDATLETRWRRVIAALGRDDAWNEASSS